MLSGQAVPRRLPGSGLPAPGEPARLAAGVLSGRLRKRRAGQVDLSGYLRSLWGGTAGPATVRSEDDDKAVGLRRLRGRVPFAANSEARGGGDCLQSPDGLQRAGLPDDRDFRRIHLQALKKLRTDAGASRAAQAGRESGRACWGKGSGQLHGSGKPDHDGSRWICAGLQSAVEPLLQWRKRGNGPRRFSPEGRIAFVNATYRYARGAPFAGLDKVQEAAGKDGRTRTQGSHLRNRAGRGSAHDQEPPHGACCWPCRTRRPYRARQERSR